MRKLDTLAALRAAALFAGCTQTGSTYRTPNLSGPVDPAQSGIYASVARGQRRRLFHGRFEA